VCRFRDRAGAGAFIGAATTGACDFTGAAATGWGTDHKMCAAYRINLDCKKFLINKDVEGSDCL